MRRGSANTQKTREKIQTTVIVKKLTNHILGEEEMSSSQVRAAEILLNKTMPNLKQSDNNNYNEDVTHSKPAKDMSKEELQSIVDGENIHAIST